MGRAVRPTREDEIRRLADQQLVAYIAETKRRIAAMTKATLRNEYRKQLRLADKILGERSGEGAEIGSLDQDQG